MTSKSETFIPDTDPPQSSIHLYPDHAKEFARLMANWAVIEQCLTVILSKLLKTDKLRALLIYTEFPALGQKFKLIRRLMYAYMDDSEMREKILATLGDAQKLSDMRNMYAHATWAGQLNPGDSIMLIHGTLPTDPKKQFHQPEYKTLAMMKADADKVTSLLGRLLQIDPNLIHVNE